MQEEKEQVTKITVLTPNQVSLFKLENVVRTMESADQTEIEQLIKKIKKLVRGERFGPLALAITDLQAAIAEESN